MAKPRDRITLILDRTWAPPGSEIRATVRVSSHRPRLVMVTMELLDLDRVAAVAQRRVRSGPDGRPVRLRLTLPDGPRHGYGLRASMRDPKGALLATTSDAIEAIEGWWQSPRHAALIEYRDAATSAQRARALRDWHVTVAQAYDWMWRHYRYQPPDGAASFTDTLGQVVSHDALRAAIRSARDAGIATLAYGSVYGAEREFVERFPDDRVFDAAGEPLSLGGTFFINDLRPGSHWRATLLTEYERAMRRFPFAGIHMDTYGPPWTAVSSDGQRLSFRELYPGLIREAAKRVSQFRDGRVLFNCVEGFPLEDVAPAPMAALYLELWPPDDRYSHIVDRIDRAQQLADGRAVVIAAYAAALRVADTADERRRAIESSVLLDALILAAGAYHHTLAEADRLIIEGYYPAAIVMTAAERTELQAAWRFSARYLHLLSGPGGALPSGAGSIRLIDAHGNDIPTRDVAEAGCVWVRARQVAGRRVINLVDLRAQSDDRWDAGRETSPRNSGWRVAGLRGGTPIGASPWTASGSARRLRPDRVGGWRLPPFRRWLMVVDPIP